MSERAYRALLIGNATYQALPKLNGPPIDVAELHKALLDPETGLHGEGQLVGPLVDLTTDQMRREIAGFFGSGRHGEQLLFYFSGHGTPSDEQDLWLCGTNTITGRDDQLIATALEAATIEKLMRDSGAEAKIIILDCCHSGGFFKGDGDLPYHLRGEGCYGLFSTHGHKLAEDHHRHNGLVTRHALNDIEHDVGFARNGELVLRNVGEVDAAIGSFNAAP